MQCSLLCTIFGYSITDSLSPARYVLLTLSLVFSLAVFVLNCTELAFILFFQMQNQYNVDYTFWERQFREYLAESSEYFDQYPPYRQASYVPFLGVYTRLQLIVNENTNGYHAKLLCFKVACKVFESLFLLMLIFLSLENPDTTELLEGSNKPFQGKYYYTPIILIALISYAIAKTLGEVILRPFGDDILFKLIYFLTILSEGLFSVITLTILILDFNIH